MSDDTTMIQVTREQARNEKTALEMARMVFSAMTKRHAPESVVVEKTRQGWDVTFTE